MTINSQFKKKKKKDFAVKVRIVVCNFHGVAIRSLSILLGWTYSRKMPLFSTLEALACFAVFFFLLVVGGFSHDGGRIYRIVIPGRQALSSWLQVSLPLALLQSSLSFILSWALPEEVSEGIIPLSLSVIRLPSRLGATIVLLEGLNHYPVALLFLR